jgi:aminoglycoside phosphotransferase (APT) family kinase protein
MFTKPSLSELLSGVSKTVEEVVLPALGDSPAADRITALLTVLDRIEAEWPVAAGCLAADNTDIEHTLRRLEQFAPAGVRLEPVGGLMGGPGAQMQPAEHDDQQSAHELAEHNRLLKSALIRAMDALDLPADPDAPPTVHQADLEVRQLLLRMLEREREANPSIPPRLNPLSRGANAMDAEETTRMTTALQSFLHQQMPEAGDIAVTNLRPLSGGASREAYIFDAMWTDEGRTTSEHCVLLRQPVSSVLESDESEERITGSRRLPQIEFAMIRRMEDAGIPVPHVLWVEPTGTWLERPFSVSRWIEGEADLSKLGEAPNLQQILQQYVEILARVHTLDPVTAGVDFLGNPTAETAAAEQVELFERGVLKQQLEEFPAIRYMIRWLRKHQPVASRVSVIHGDFRLGNFMWDDDGIVAMLDWEQCHLGDPLEEIAFMYWPLWTLEPLIPLRDFIGRYEEASGIHVDHDSLAWYRVFIELKMSVVLLTGMKSFYATPERQLLYGATPGFEMLRECQLRVVEELLNDGPTIDFRGRAASLQSA